MLSYEYKINQLKPSKEDILFLKYRQALNNGGVSLENYQEVYTGTIEVPASFERYKILEFLYKKFNVDIPKEFTGHSLSVSDIISLSKKDKEKKGGCDFENYYVNDIGFQRV